MQKIKSDLSVIILAAGLGRRMRDCRGIRPRMGRVVHFLHSIRRQMCVDLCGAQALVAQELLHASQVRPVVQQVGGEAVT